MEKGDAPERITKRLGPMFFYTNQTAAKYQVNNERNIFLISFYFIFILYV
jgi:hypothetical protein